MNGSVGILIALTAGVLSFLSPCVLPLVPSYLSFVTGMTLDDLQEGTDRARVITHAVLFVSGFTLVFMLLGATASFLGQFAHAYKDWIARIGGGLVIVLGLHLLGVFRISALLRERRVHLSDKPAGFLGTLAVGAAFGAAWDSVHRSRPGRHPDHRRARGRRYGRGSGCCSSTRSGWPSRSCWRRSRSTASSRPFDGSGAGSRGWRRGAGVLLIALGLLLVTGSFTALSGWLTRFTPGFILERI